MRKILLTIIISAMTLVSCGTAKEHVHVCNNLISDNENTHHFICSKCGETITENHIFDQKIIDSKFLRKLKTCQDYAAYYTSCKCGKSSGETLQMSTFPDIEGGFANHSYVYHARLEPTEDSNGYEAYYSCENCKALFNENKQKIDKIIVIPCSKLIVINNKLNGKSFDLVTPNARNYLNADDKADFLYTASSGYGDFTEGITLSWSNNGAKSPFKVQVSKSSAFDSISFESSEIKGTSTTLYNQIPGLNYYRIVDSNGETSGTDSFNILGSLRTINTTNNIVNIRDIGGWKNFDGKHIKYGKLFRSAMWDNLGLTGIEKLKELGIKTELDVRLSETGKDYSKSKCPVEGIKFYNYGMGQYTQIVPGGIQSSDIKRINIGNIFTLLSKEDSYPLVYHCSAGADRTGTISFLIEGLLGVPYETLVQDFELTTFYQGKRWRSNIQLIDNKPTFDSTGIMQDDSSNYVAFGLLYNEIMTRYNAGGSLSASIRKYLKQACYVSDDTLNKVINLLLE